MGGYNFEVPECALFDSFCGEGKRPQLTTIQQDEHDGLESLVGFELADLRKLRGQVEAEVVSVDHI